MSTKSSWILELELERDNHTNRIYVSPCGKYLVGEGKGSPTLWVLRSPEYYHCLSTGDARTWFVDFTLDGDKCITYCGSKFIVWESASGEPYLEVEVERRIEDCRLLAPANKLAIHCSEDNCGSIAIFDIAMRKQCFSYGPEEYLKHASFSPCGNYAVIGTKREPILFDFTSDRRVPFEEAEEFFFDPTGQLILSRLPKNRFELHNTVDCRTTTTMSRPTNLLGFQRHISFSRDGSRLFFHGTDREIWALNTASGTIERKFLHDEPVTQFSVEPTGEKLWSYSHSPSRHAAHYWDYESQNLVSVHENYYILAVPAFDKANQRVLVPQLHCSRMDILDYTNGRSMGDVKVDSEYYMPACVFPGSKKFAAIRSSYRVGIWKPASAQD